MSDTPYLDECNANYRSRLAREEAEEMRIRGLETRIAQLEAALRELRMDIENTGHIGLLMRMRFHRIIDTALGSSVETLGDQS